MICVRSIILLCLTFSRSPFRRLGLAGLLMSTALPSLMSAQEPDSGSIYGKNAATQSAIGFLNDQWKHSIVRVSGPHREPVLGTIVMADGLIVAKLSELHQPFTCETFDGRNLNGQIVASQPQLDLALLKVDGNELRSVVFPNIDQVPAVGEILISAHPDSTHLRLGVVSTSRRGLPIRQPPMQNGVSMGISVAGQLESKTVLSDGKYLQRRCVRVRSVSPRGTGEAANLLIDDLICSVNEQPISSLDDWLVTIRDISAGQKVRFGVIRRDKFFVTSAQALSGTQRTVHDLWGGGPFSEQRFNFESVIIHDTEILPQDCGGPVFDLQGNLVGINIARTLRVASYCIPARQVADWIEATQPNAKLQRTK